VTGHNDSPTVDSGLTVNSALADRSTSTSIRDVARAAQVSHQTVSRVINGSSSVKPTTRKAVLDAIDQLGFRPNRAARALAGGPVQSVTVLMSNTRLYGPAAALEGIEEATRAAGFALGVRVVESGTPEAVRDAVERAVEPSGSLIIIAYDQPGMAALRVAPSDVPLAAIVETPRGREAAGKPWVWIDDRRAAREATNHLLDLGHETVHYVSIPPCGDASPRATGWRLALEEAGVRVPEPVRGGWGPRAGYEAGQKLVRDMRVTAVLCGNDELAFGVARAMNEAGRSVPGSVSIVGFDDTPGAAFYSPALTTVRLDFPALGRACFEKLLTILGRDTGRGKVDGPTAKLVIRESSGPPIGGPRASRRRSQMVRGTGRSKPALAW
jgi:DNA-binding LacI/PurR family transcriptional regulator